MLIAMLIIIERERGGKWDILYIMLTYEEKNILSCSFECNANRIKISRHLIDCTGDFQSATLRIHSSWIVNYYTIASFSLASRVSAVQEETLKKRLNFIFFYFVFMKAIKNSIFLKDEISNHKITDYKLFFRNSLFQNFFLCSFPLE